MAHRLLHPNFAAATCGIAPPHPRLHPPHQAAVMLAPLPLVYVIPLPIIYIPPPSVVYAAAAPPYFVAQIPFDERPNRVYIHRHEDFINGGLSEEVIARFLKTRDCDDEVKSGNVVEEDSKICVVCQDNLCQENQRIGILRCGHEFHAACIKRWLREKKVCPLCKAIAL